MECCYPKCKGSIAATLHAQGEVPFLGPLDKKIGICSTHLVTLGSSLLRLKESNPDLASLFSVFNPKGG